MKLKFLGATGTVTGSKYLLSFNGKSILIDCGLFQGLKKLRLRNWETLPIQIKEIDSIVLTHAHIDHSGYIPRLIKMGFSGKIYCTHATKDLCEILLPDCGYLMEEEARYANKKGFSKHSPALPLFTRAEAEDALKQFVSIGYEEILKLGDGIEVEFRNAGHILGASIATFHGNGKSICFSGDLGRQHDPIMESPATPDQVDYLVMESTYGDRVHPDTDPLEELENLIKRTVSRGGVIVVPAFAVGRAQALLYYIGKLKEQSRIPEIPIFLNSPMAIDVTTLYGNYSSVCKLTASECRAMRNIATFVHTPEESKKLNEANHSMLVISASGMATGGRVIHHLKAFASNPNNTILFTGFQAAGTRGEKMLSGAETIRIHGEDIPVKAEVLNIESLSAHADSNGLLHWLSSFKNKPKKIFVTHGEPSAAAVFRDKVEKELGIDAIIPEYLEEVEL